MLRPEYRALYAAFDLFPSTKGAAVHIDRFAQTLFNTISPGLLCVLGNDSLPIFQREKSADIVRFSQPVQNFLERTLRYGAHLEQLLQEPCFASLELAHFRDPWSGVPIINHLKKSAHGKQAREPRRLAGTNDPELPKQNPSSSFSTIYEVNAFPSIELPHRYPMLGEATLDKIRSLEKYCCDNASHIIVPSATICSAVIRYGVPREKITVIPNGADVPDTKAPRPIAAPAKYILYFGATQVWQGVDVLLRAFARLVDIPDLNLIVCASHETAKLKGLKNFAAHLEISDRVIWMSQLPQSELSGWISHALLTVAPLTNCARNTTQGCAPLKILESMAHGTPVVASDLPAVRELITDNENGRLVHPERPAELARAIRVLLQYPQQLRTLGENARRHIESNLTWTQSTQQLVHLYQRLSLGRGGASPTANTDTSTKPNKTSLIKQGAP